MSKYQPFSTLPQPKLSLSLGDLNLDIKMWGRHKVFEQYFYVVLFVALSKAVVTFRSVEKILMCDIINQTRKTVFDLTVTVKPRGVPLCVGLGFCCNARMRALIFIVFKEKMFCLSRKWKTNYFKSRNSTWISGRGGWLRSGSSTLGRRRGQKDGFPGGSELEEIGKSFATSSKFLWEKSTKRYGPLRKGLEPYSFLHGGVRDEPQECLGSVNLS